MDLRRLAVVVALGAALAGCAVGSDASPVAPDAGQACGDTLLGIEAPRAELSYATDLAVLADVTRPDVDGYLNLRMVDDLGNHYASTRFDAGLQNAGVYTDIWRYQLAAGHRYVLTIANCCDAKCTLRRDPQSVEFYIAN